ncbi:hypothetical protein A2U01_0017671, partial [Trifolium medium]|nr:hypothetical protein [Trifolium medium]
PSWRGAQDAGRGGAEAPGSGARQQCCSSGRV